jgi:hypothetical protein
MMSRTIFVWDEKGSLGIGLDCTMLGDLICILLGWDFARVAKEEGRLGGQA